MAVFLVGLVIGTLLAYTMTMIWIIPVFWLHSKTGLRDIGWTLGRFSGRPHGIFRGWMRRALMSVIPYAFINSVPTYMLFAGPTLLGVAHMAAVAVCAFGFMVWFWSRGLRAYASASS